MPSCKHCGGELVPGERFCSMCGAPTPKTESSLPAAPRIARCLNCGASADRDIGYCAVCGCAIPPEQEYEKLTERLFKARDIRKKNNVARLVAMLILLPAAAFLVMMLLAVVMICAGFEYLLDNETVSLLGGLTILISPLAVLTGWIIMRRRAFKQAGMTYGEYRHLLGKLKRLPKDFLYNW